MMRPFALLGTRVVAAVRGPSLGRRRAIGGSLAGVLLVMACGWVGGGAQPTPAPTAAPAPPSPSPSPAAGVSIPAAPAVPSPGVAPSPSPSPSPSAGGESYTIAEGDTLASIAERYYGDPTQWRRIYDANREAIGDNPDNVRIGTVIRIPPR
jgi:nucleoid-associated protein YgaU